MSSGAQRTQILTAYKHAIKLIKRLPGERRDAALAEARQSLRSHKDESDPAKQLDLLKTLTAKIAYLRTIVPRRPGDESLVGGGVFVFRNGELVPGRGNIAGQR